MPGPRSARGGSAGGRRRSGRGSWWSARRDSDPCNGIAWLGASARHREKMPLGTRRSSTRAPPAACSATTAASQTTRNKRAIRSSFPRPDRISSRPVSFPPWVYDLRVDGDGRLPENVLTHWLRPSKRSSRSRSRCCGNQLMCLLILKTSAKT